MASDPWIERQRRAFEIAMRAFDVDRKQREQFLAQACADDAELRKMAQSLVDQAVNPASFLGPSILQRINSDVDIDNFEIIREISSGGMGVVYEARQLEPSRIVALKVLRPGLIATSALKRFQRESKVLSMLNHPGIARVYQIGSYLTEGGEEPFLAMEFLRGEPLSHLLKHRSLGVDDAIALIIQVCDAVQHAHDMGVLHRDIKPSNIIIQEDGGPKIIDFGVARFFKRNQPVDDDASSSHITSITNVNNGIVGTPSYMCPEQLVGEHARLKPSCDVYSIGMILYQLIAGRLPFEVADLAMHEVNASVQDRVIPPLSHFKPELRADLEIICSRGLRPRPEDRYQSAADFADDLRRYLNNEPIRSGQVGMLRRMLNALRWRARHHRTSSMS